MATAKKLECNARHLEKLDRITIRVYKDGSDGFTKDQLEHVAQEQGISVNAWIIDAIKQQL